MQDSNQSPKPQLNSCKECNHLKMVGSQPVCLLDDNLFEEECYIIQLELNPTS